MAVEKRTEDQIFRELKEKYKGDENALEMIAHTENDKSRKPTAALELEAVLDAFY
jgi:hypothetical protein